MNDQLKRRALASAAVCEAWARQMKAEGRLHSDTLLDAAKVLRELAEL